MITYLFDTPKPVSREKQLRARIRETRAEMKLNGIKRSSFMNGGHSPESYRLNALMFRLELELKDAIIDR